MGGQAGLGERLRVGSVFRLGKKMVAVDGRGDSIFGTTFLLGIKLFHSKCLNYYF